MSASQGFVDLRTSPLSSGSHTDDSVWPSFTDIMTVVVMIFLMSLVVILLRNVELMKAEQESTRLAQLKASENVVLEDAIRSLEKRITEVQLKLEAQILQTAQSNTRLEQSQDNVSTLMAQIQALKALRDRLQQENTQQAAEILAAQGRLQVVEADKDELETLKQQIEQDRQSLEEQKQQLLIQLEAITGSRDDLETRLGEQKEEFTALQQQQRELLARLQALQTQKQSLTSQLETQASEFDELEAVYATLQQDNRSLKERITDAEKLVAGLEQDVAELEQELGTAEQTIEVQGQELVAVKEEVETKSQELEVVKEEVQDKDLQLEEVKEEVEVKEQQLEVVQTEVQEKSEQLIETQEKFTELEKKYFELVGPARSELDKYVVKIRYRLIGGRRIIEIQQPGDDRMIPVSDSELHQQLVRLKEEKGDQLYTKVIIPQDSGLSYDQAWRFTQDILTQYDYYYQ